MRIRWPRVFGCLFSLVVLITLPIGLFLYRIKPTPREALIVKEARSCLDDIYDSDYYPGGPPPRGRGACTDVVYWAYLPLLDLQSEVDNDRRALPNSSELKIDRNIDYRWCPTLVEYFQRHGESLPTDVNWKTVWTFRPGDVVFYDDHRGSMGHVGIVSDRWSFDGKPLLIHNPGPRAVEENGLTSNKIVGHFRLSD